MIVFIIFDIPWLTDASLRPNFSIDCSLSSASSWYHHAFAIVNPMFDDQVSIYMMGLTMGMGRSCFKIDLDL